MWIIQYYENEGWHCYDDGHDSWNVYLLALDALKALRKDFPEFEYRLLKCEVLDD